MITVRRIELLEAKARFEELVRLRIEVFRAFPYLYEGDLDYERSYLETYLKDEKAAIVAAFFESAVVGMATASPLENHFDEFAQPFKERGIDPAGYWYFGESVLMPEFRGQGVGVRFFDEREKAARENGFRKCLFSAVQRSPEHPLRPAGYMPLDGFWANRGYEKIPDLVAHFSWRDIGDAAETTKPMEFWQKTLEQRAF